MTSERPVLSAVAIRSTVARLGLALAELDLGGNSSADLGPVGELSHGPSLVLA